MAGRSWQDTIYWAENRGGDLCPGDMQSVIRDLVQAVRILGTTLDKMEERTKKIPDPYMIARLEERIAKLEADAKSHRPTAYERVLGG